MDHASGLDTYCDGRDLPVLQDEASVNAWAMWGVEWRDLVIVTPDLEIMAVYNLTEHDLSEPANQQELLDLLAAAAE